MKQDELRLCYVDGAFAWFTFCRVQHERKAFLK